MRGADSAVSTRICLVTPAHLSSNPRIVKEADALTEAGYEVIVVAGLFGGWGETAESEFASRKWEVRRVRYGYRAGKPVYYLQSGRRLAAQAIHTLTGWCPDVALHPVATSLKAVAMSVRADLYIAHNLIALPAAACAAARHQGKVGFDAEDFYSGELEKAEQNSATIKQIRAIERKWIPVCDYITAASPGIADAYVRTYGIARPTVILNVFPVGQAPDRSCSSSGVGRLYWFSQTIGLDRGLQTAVEAIAISKARPHLYLRGNPATGAEQSLRKLADSLDISDSLHFLPVAAPAQMVRLASSYDVGLASEISNTVNHDICLANKIFAYLLAGLPVIASDTSAQAELAARLRDAVFLYAQSSSVSLARAFDELFLSESKLAAAKNRAWTLGQERYNWDIEKQSFLKVVSRCLEN